MTAPKSSRAGRLIESLVPEQHFPVIIEQDDEGNFLVSCPTLKGCRSYGRTMEEAMKHIREAILLSLDHPKQPDLRFIGVRDLVIPPDA